MPQLSTSIAYTSCHISCSHLCIVENWCAQGRGGPASREAWSGHSTTSLEATRAAMVPLSPSPIWPPHISHPSIHLSQCFLPARVPAAASHVTIEPGLGGCCSESRECPIWATGETEERQEEDREVDSNRPDVFLKDRLNQSYFLPQCSFDFQEKERRKRIPNRWNHARFVIVSGRAF